MHFLKGLLVLVVAMCVRGARAAEADQPQANKVRVGVYDNRAIAIAYAASRFNLVAEKKEAYVAAKDAGDKDKMKELDAWGVRRQRQLHFQGFGRVPVDDLLEPLKTQVAKFAAAKQLAVITMSCEFLGEGVELVDVTDDLVQLFEPTESTLKMAREVRKVKPVDLVELSQLSAKE